MQIDEKTINITDAQKKRRGRPPKDKNAGEAKNVNGSFKPPKLTAADEQRRDKIKNAMLKELKAQGKNKMYYRELVSDYIRFWEMLELLQKDVDERGAIISWDNGGGQSGYKRNECIQEMSRISTQMLRILKSLNITETDAKTTTNNAKAGELNGQYDI